MELLNVKNVTYHYEGTDKGISNVNFNGLEGDMIAIVGKNGAGKSTLLNILSGINLPQTGEITCLPTLTYHDLGFSPQKQSIDWYLNVYDNIMLGAVLAGLNKKEAKDATDSVSKLLDLYDLSKKSPDSLSGGQQQRLQVARALVHDPKILFLDEPTAGLDYQYSCKLFEYLKSKSSKENRLIFISSHDLAMLEDYCDKILYLQDGKQLYFGDMKDFFKTFHLTNEILITYSGVLSEKTQALLRKKGIVLSEQSLILSDDLKDELNNTIVAILKEVSITSIENRKIGLKGIMNNKEVKKNA